MRKLISILVALGVILGLSLMAAPVAAVDAPVEVEVSEPLAGQLSDYEIVFHNGSNLLLADGDFIDVMFNPGTGAADLSSVTAVWMAEAATKAGLATAIPSAPAWVLVGTTSIRIYVDVDIVKCQWVLIILEDVTNPGPCFHHIQVGSSTHTPVASEDFAIFSLKMCLVEGKNLISLPAYPEDPAITVVLADLFAKYELEKNTTTPFTFSVWYWDAAALKWLKYASDSSFKDLTKIEVGKAYWIKVNKDVCFYFKGTPYPEDQGPPPKFCWYVRSFNMVGFTSLTPMFASDYLDYALLPPFFLTYAVIAIYDWDETTQSYVDLGWPGVDPVLVPGEGYWMAFIDAACIIPPIQ